MVSPSKPKGKSMPFLLVTNTAVLVPARTPSVSTAEFLISVDRKGRLIKQKNKPMHHCTALHRLKPAETTDFLSS